MAAETLTVNGANHSHVSGAVVQHFLKDTVHSVVSKSLLGKATSLSVQDANHVHAPVYLLWGKIGDQTFDIFTDQAGAPIGAQDFDDSVTVHGAAHVVNSERPNADSASELAMHDANHMVVSVGDVGFYGIILTVQDSAHSQVNYTPYLTTGGGTHDNTSWVDYGGDDYLKCLHQGDVLTGTYTSEIYDRSSSDTYLVYILADIVVTGTGTTWADQIPTPDTWADAGADSRTWTEIFELTAGPSVEMSLFYGDTNPPTNEVKKMEILGTVVTGRYYYITITITDPNKTVNALVENYELKFCQ